MDLKSKFESGFSYDVFLEKYGSDTDRIKWKSVHDLVSLSDDQQSLITGFQRQMNVLVMAGAWCGDCVSQLPILNHFENATQRINVRYVDRDADAELAQELKICGGSRVPQVVIMSEDFLSVSREGDRTLSRYRQMAQQQFGSGCPTGLGLADDPVFAEVVQDWVDIFERAQLILRLSPSLRKRHGD
jgi:thiol-disulfide isomerase/thioredoxin